MRKILIDGIIAIYCVLCFTHVKAQRVNQPVQWFFTTVSVSDKKAKLIFTANLADEWHIYPQFTQSQGPMPTVFTFLPDGNYSLNGKMKESGAPVKKYDNVFMMEVVRYDKTVVFSQDIDLQSPVAVIRGKIAFMSCTYSYCRPPEEIEFTMQVKAKDEMNIRGK